MFKLVLLDTGVLGFATSPRPTVRDALTLWLSRLMREGHIAFVPEIADYELRRELLRRGSKNGIRKLDELGATVSYLPIDTETMRLAATLWAQARSQGKPVANEHALDADVILCAQARLLSES